MFVLSLALVGCASAPPPKPMVPPYTPNFAFKTEPSTKKLDVTIGVIQPQFSAGAALYKESYREDETLKAMLSGMSATFNEVLLAKGFNTKGPFVSLNDMTFPEKKGSDLLLYPEFDFQITLKLENQHNLVVAGQKNSGGSGLLGLVNAINSPGHDPMDDQTCDAVITVSGNLLFVAQEPLSGERMWIKRLDVSKGRQVFTAQHGAMCSDVRHLNQEMKNAWARAHEIVYQDSMKAFNTYVSGEEFQMLKKQSLDLRARKTY
jgi:hypothetical protein